MKRTCFRCGATATTHDHAMPRCFFPNPKPPTVRTVPSCRPCNEGVQADEEYVRDRLAGSFLKTRPKKFWETAFRSLQRSEARGKARAFKADVAPLVNPVILGGEPIQFKIRLDKERSNHVFEKVVRAHYFLWTNQRMDDVHFHFELPTSATYPKKRYEYASSWVKKAAKNRTHLITYGEWNWVSWAKGPDNEISGVWLIGLLKTHVVLGFTLPQEKARGRISLAEQQLLVHPDLTIVVARPHDPVSIAIAGSRPGRETEILAHFCFRGPRNRMRLVSTMGL